MIADIFGVLVLFGIGTYMWRSVPETKAPIFNIQDGKQRSLQAKGDAGLYIEKVRRRAVQQVGRLDPRKLRETSTQMGSATGVIETFMITGLCDPLPCPVTCPPDILFDGGGPGSEFCPASGNLDAGNYQTKVCESCPPDTLFDGGGAGANFKTIKGSGTLDAGNQPICESCPPDTIFDGGGAGANFKTIKGSGTLDAGNQPICESCPPDTIFDGGGAGANFKTIKGSGVLDGKFHNTKACGI